MLIRTHLLIPSPRQHLWDIQTPALACINVVSANNEHTQELFFPNVLPSVQLSICITSSPSLSSMRHSNRISECDLSTSCPPPSAFLPLAPVALGGTREPLGPRGVGLRWRPRPRSLGSHVLTISSCSVKLCKYLSPVSSSLQCQLRVSVQFFLLFFVFLGCTAVQQGHSCFAEGLKPFRFGWKWWQSQDACNRKNSRSLKKAWKGLEKAQA